jgi:hypothetical protein
MASRFNFLNPAYYIRMEPFARREALKAALRLVGTLNLVLFLAKMEGAKVESDPRNADFGKIRIGNTRAFPTCSASAYRTTAQGSRSPRRSQAATGTQAAMAAAAVMAARPAMTAAEATAASSCSRCNPYSCRAN